MSFQIISDSACDLGLELAKENKIDLVPFYVSFDGEKYLKENTEIEVADFFQKLIDNKNIFPKTSLPNVQDYIDAFTPYVEKNTPVICICLAKILSGSVGSAITARDIIVESNPNAKITVIDSTLCTMSEGLVVMSLVKLRDKDYSYENAVEKLNELILTGRIIFTIGEVSYLFSGGRAGKVAGMIGGVLGVKPIIMMRNGELSPLGVSRNRKKTLSLVISQAEKFFKTNNESPSDYDIVAGYGYDFEEVVSFNKELTLALSKIAPIDKIPIRRIGAVVASHTGPNAIGLGFIKKF